MRLRILLGGMILAAALALAPATALGAEQRYASPGGAGDTCSQLSPCDGRYAMSGTTGGNPVADGDEVILLPGTYDLMNSSEVTVTTSIDIHGQAGSPVPVLGGTATTGLLKLSNPAATLHDVDLEYGGTPASGAYGALMVSEGTAYRVVAHTLSANALACTLSGDTTGPDALIRDSVCWGQGSAGVGVGLACMCDSFNARLRNVDAFGTDYGIRFDSQKTGQTFAIEARNVIADGNVDDVWAEAGVSGQTNVHTSIALDHSAYDSRGAHAVGTGSSFSATPVGADATNVVATPAQMLVSPSLGNFHQLATSPTIDKGVTDSLTGTTDLDGNARIQGAIDIGAYETALTTPPGGGSSNPQGKSPAKKKCKKKKHRAASAKKCKKPKK